MRGFAVVRVLKRCPMAQLSLALSLRVHRTVKGKRYFLTENRTKEESSMVYLMDKEPRKSPIKAFTLAITSMVNPMVKENLHMLTVLRTRATGSMAFVVVKVSRRNLMAALNLKAPLLMAYLKFKIKVKSSDDRVKKRLKRITLGSN